MNKKTFDKPSTKSLAQVWFEMNQPVVEMRSKIEQGQSNVGIVIRIFVVITLLALVWFLFHLGV